MENSTLLVFSSSLILVIFASLNLIGQRALAVELPKFSGPSSVASFQHVTVDVKTGNVFIGAINSLYHLSEDMSIIGKYQTGPIAPDCSTDAPCDGQKLIDNVNKVLEIDPNARVLLACGSANFGLCTVHSISNLTHDGQMLSNHTSNYVAGQGSVVAFFDQATYPPYSGASVLYSAASYDERPEALTAATVSSRNLHIVDERYQLDYARNTETTVSYIKMLKKFRSTYKIQYIYGFGHAGFSYFVTIQRVNLTSDIYESRLARVCQVGSTLAS